MGLRTGNDNAEVQKTDSGAETTIETSTPAGNADSGSSETSAGEGDAANSTQDAPDQSSQNTQDKTKVEFKPDFSYSVRDKKHEFDEFLRPVIKDAETQKKVKELYEKAMGLETVKAGAEVREKEIQRLSSVEKQHQDLNGKLQHIDNILKKGDLHSFFNILQIPEQQILKYALERVKYMELPPEQKAEYDRSVQERQQLYTLEQQNAFYQTQAQQNAVQARTIQLDGYLMTPQVNQVANEFDQRAGKAGAFKEEVIKRGQLAWFTRGEDISIEQATQEVFALLGRNTNQVQQQTGFPGTQQASAPQATMPEAKPVIPNVKGGGNSSPAKKAYKSVEELRKLSATMNDNEN